MKHALCSARLLVASDNADDARQIQRQLKADFSQVALSTDADRALADFERCAPDVLVLAFDRLDKAQHYYLGLYRLGDAGPRHAHRTVILCSKDEVQAVFELCKRAYFDDYVLYWPHSHDGPRLAMSLWNACRDAASLRPAPAPPAALPAGTPALQEPPRPARPRVMVVEDDAFARTLVGRALDPLQWDTVFAVDGATALAALRQQRPDVILMDIHLPGQDGVALTQQIKASPELAAIPIVMMTGDACKAALVSSMEAGAAAFVVKPFTRDALTRRLQAVLKIGG